MDKFSPDKLRRKDVVEVQPQTFRVTIEEDRKDSGKECPDTQISEEGNWGKCFNEEVAWKSGADRRTIVEVHSTDKIAGLPLKLQMAPWTAGKHLEIRLKQLTLATPRAFQSKTISENFGEVPKG